jgi:hypothetical protein
MTSATGDAVVDYHGRIMFFCAACGAPITKDDFFELGLRLPDNGESRDDYCEAELIDAITHLDCLKAARAS